MSTLKVNNIQTTSGGSSSTPEQIQQGRAKLWLNYNGSTNSIRDDFNVTSVTDEGTGTYTVNWDTNAANANYAIMTNYNHKAGVVLGKTVMVDRTAFTISSSQFRLEVYNSANASVDMNEVHCACFGD